MLNLKQTFRWLWGRKLNLINFGTHRLSFATYEILLKTATVDLKCQDIGQIKNRVAGLGPSQSMELSFYDFPVKISLHLLCFDFF